MTFFDLDLSMKWLAMTAGVWPGFRFVVRPTIAKVREMRAFVRRIDGALGHVDAMATWLGPNGGHSLGDLIRHSSVRLDWLIDQYKRPVFEFGPDGSNVRINDEFTSQFGYGAVDMLGQRWKNFIHHDDREHVMREWAHALRDQRLFEHAFRAVTRGGVVIQVRVVIEPQVHGTTGVILRWIGFIERVQVSA